MTLLIGALTIGLILALAALGVRISFRIFGIADITVDGSLTFGASVAAVLLVGGSAGPLVATAAGFGAGLLAGLVTGLLQTRFRIDGLLSGILVMTALYSVNLHVMGRSNVPLLHVRTLATVADEAGPAWFGGDEVALGRWLAPAGDLALLVMVAAIVVAVALGLDWFFRTEIGTAMRASGDNPQMIRALGADVERLRVIGLALANGLVGLAGALWTQVQGFADAQMGIGMVVWGLASVILGEALAGAAPLGVALTATVLGSILFRLLIALALGFGLNPNDLKLVTALFVFVALVLPQGVARWRRAQATRRAVTGGGTGLRG